MRFTESETPGMRVSHEYTVTSERDKGGFHEATARVLRFARTLPKEPEPPVVPYDHFSPWRETQRR